LILAALRGQTDCAAVLIGKGASLNHADHVPTSRPLSRHQLTPLNLKGRTDGFDSSESDESFRDRVDVDPSRG
jgi:hypothetical protein